MPHTMFAGLWWLVALLLFLGGPFLLVWFIMVVGRASRDLRRIANALEHAVRPQPEQPRTTVLQTGTAEQPVERHVALSMFGR